MLLSAPESATPKVAAEKVSVFLRAEALVVPVEVAASGASDPAAAAGILLEGGSVCPLQMAAQAAE